MAASAVYVCATFFPLNVGKSANCTRLTLYRVFLCCFHCDCASWPQVGRVTPSAALTAGVIKCRVCSPLTMAISALLLSALQKCEDCVSGAERVSCLLEKAQMFGWCLFFFFFIAQFNEHCWLLCLYFSSKLHRRQWRAQSFLHTQHKALVFFIGMAGFSVRLVWIFRHIYLKVHQFRTCRPPLVWRPTA